MRSIPVCTFDESWNTLCRPHVACSLRRRRVCHHVECRRDRDVRSRSEVGHIGTLEKDVLPLVRPGCGHSGSGRATVHFPGRHLRVVPTHRVKTIYDELARCLFRWQAFAFTMAKHVDGTRQVFHQRMSTFSGTRCQPPELRRSEGCGRRHPQCLICNVGGKSFSRAPTPELVTLSEPSRPVCVPSTCNCTVKGSGTRQWPCWANSQVASLPTRMGFLGLRSAVRGTDAAYWASWA